MFQVLRFPTRDERLIADFAWGILSPSYTKNGPWCWFFPLYPLFSGLDQVTALYLMYYSIPVHNRGQGNKSIFFGSFQDIMCDGKPI